VIEEGGGGDRGEIGGGAVIGEKRSALTTSPSVVISGHQWSSVGISGHLRRLTPLTVRCLDLLVISIGLGHGTWPCAPERLAQLLWGLCARAVQEDGGDDECATEAKDGPEPSGGAVGCGRAGGR